MPCAEEYVCVCFSTDEAWRAEGRRMVLLQVYSPAPKNLSICLCMCIFRGMFTVQSKSAE
jgi:hypothetical protein